MVDSKSHTFRNKERGNTAIIALVVLVLVAVGAIAYLTTQMDEKPSAEKPAGVAAAATTADVQTAAGEEAKSEEAAPPLDIKPGNPVVAKLDGKDITRLDVFRFIQTLNPQTQQAPIDQLFPLALNEIINSEIISNKASKVNLDNDKAVKEQLAAAKTQIVRGVFIQREIEKATTEERLKAAYDLYVKSFPEIPEIKTRHILVEDEKLAKDLIKQLSEGGDFVALAKEHSIDATKDKGGDLGYISKQSQVIPVFMDAVFALKTGETSKKPVKSEFGYHIIEAQETRNRPPAEFEQAKPFLASQLQAAVMNELLSNWRKEAKVSVFDINGEAIKPADAEPSSGESAEEPAKAE